MSQTRAVFDDGALLYPGADWTSDALAGASDGMRQIDDEEGGEVSMTMPTLYGERRLVIEEGTERLPGGSVRVQWSEPRDGLSAGPAASTCIRLVGAERGGNPPAFHPQCIISGEGTAELEIPADARLASTAWSFATRSGLDIDECTAFRCEARVERDRLEHPIIRVLEADAF